MGTGVNTFFDIGDFAVDEPTVRRKINGLIIRCYTCDGSIRPGEPRLFSDAGVEVCEVCCTVNGLVVNA